MLYRTFDYFSFGMNLTSNIITEISVFELKLPRLERFGMK